MGRSPVQRYPIVSFLLSACKMNWWLCSKQLGEAGGYSGGIGCMKARAKIDAELQGSLG